MGDRYTVYLDVVFAINFLMDYVLLWATAKFSQIRTSAGRLGLGAAVGALYSLALLLPPLDFLLTAYVKILFSIAMVYISFPHLRPKRFLQALGYFYLVAFTMGGAMFGAIYLINKDADLLNIFNGMLMFVSNIKYTWLLAGIIAAVLFAKYGVGFVKRNFYRSFFRVPVVIRFGNKKASTKALIDTGNQLKDPLTQKPVMIIEYNVLKHLLPAELAQAVAEGGNRELDLDRIVSLLEGSDWASRIRVIPFTSIGRYKGMLLGVRPDEVIVVTSDNTVRIKDIIIGLYFRQLSPGGSYRALLHPNILGM